jgi:molecular chaperone HscB
MPESHFMKSKGAASADYHALFGMQERYQLDSRELERHYLERSKRVHPDRFVNAPAHERVAALQQSMLLNDAYKTLKDPLARAEYLLSRNGLEIADNEALDPGFLMEMLELREELAEAKHACDRPTLRRLENTMLDRRDAARTQVGELFAEFYTDTPASADHQPGPPAVLTTIKEHVIVLRYISRYLHEFDALDDEE